MTGRAFGGAWLGVSLAAHVSLLAAAHHGEAVPRPQHPPSFVQLTLPPAPQAAPEPTAPPKAPTSKPASKPTVTPKPAAQLREPRPAAPDPPATAELPTSDVTGTTLISENGTGFSAPPGSGHERDGALPSAAASSVPARLVPSPSGIVPHPPPALIILPPSALARKPTPPPLTALLARNYPPEARRIGLSGDATVRARIEANGAIRLATTVSESSPGFGDACRRTLVASQWSPPLDRSGRAVATFISYRCKFRVND